MNYRHIYHAGNFADVFKHIIITRIIEYLKRKPQAFRVIDTHAGPGLYDLSSKEAQKTGEWQNGIARFWNASLPQENAPLIAPWLDAVHSLNSNGMLERYPGSPLLIRSLLRKQDRLTAIELHETDYKALHYLFEGDYQVRVLHLDGWLALGAHVPPKEKRGLILVDPPFEQPGEFERLVDGVKKAVRRFAGGVYMLWYPVKDYDAIRQFTKLLHASGIRKILQLELRIRKNSASPRLDGSGIIIINPPYVLEQEIENLAPLLISRLGEDKQAQFIKKWIRNEQT